MEKHVYFWVGMFVGAVLLLLICFGLTEFFQKGAALHVVSAVFGLVIGLVILFVLVLLFRDKVFGKVIGAAEVDLEKALEKVKDALKRGSPRDSLEEAARITVSWYSWTRLYRWVISTAIALMVGIVGFATLGLLVEQNRSLSEQVESERIQVELVGSRLSERVRELLAPSDSVDVFASTELFALNPVRGSDCIVEIEGHNVEVAASRSRQEEVRQMYRRIGIQQRVLDGLHAISLASGGVAVGAISVLGSLGRSVVHGELYLRDVYIPNNFSVFGATRVRIENSVIEGLSCINCSLEIHNSVVYGVEVRELVVTNSYFQDMVSIGRAGNSGFVFRLDGRVFEGYLIGEDSNLEGLDGLVGPEGIKCENSLRRLGRFCNVNPFFSCVPF